MESISKTVTEIADKAKHTITGKQPIPRRVQLRDFQKSWRKFEQEVAVFYQQKSFKADVNVSFGAPSEMDLDDMSMKDILNFNADKKSDLQAKTQKEKLTRRELQEEEKILDSKIKKHLQLIATAI